MSAQQTDAPTAEETMTIAASREVRDRQVLLVGVGPPNAAANLARRLHAPDCVLVYESGAIEAKPVKLPLSIGDDDLAETAAELVSVPEMFNYWVGGGRIDVGFLGAAQIDRFCNINTTVIGSYDDPEVRLPGAGGAPEIAAASREVIVIVRQSTRSFVEKLDFVTSIGHGSGAGDRERLGFPGAGPSVVITDLGVLRPHPEDRELELVAVHPGVDVDRVREATGWPLRVRERVETTAPPTEPELSTLRAMRAGG
ncbi:MAG: glutaconate CoA-transferase, subunit [Solirubrobacteraceae bacterium]|nr:glutaconate CoA-transferase, subunit [Solirubrobacteraceae bacterium]